MLKSELLDLDTLYAVQKASPKSTPFPLDEAREILSILEGLTADIAPRTGRDNREYWQVYLAELQPHLSESITPKRLGLFLRAMGLTLIRHGQGFCVCWSQDQLEILIPYFSGGLQVEG
jgi:hypothetical protein